MIVLGSHAGSALVVSEPLASPDAIVSLASHEWERLPAAAALARQYPEALVVLTRLVRLSQGVHPLTRTLHLRKLCVRSGGESQKDQSQKR